LKIKETKNRKDKLVIKADYLKEYFEDLDNNTNENEIEN